MGMSGSSFGGGGNVGDGIFGLLHSLFNNNKDPFQGGFDSTKPYFDDAKNNQNPFFNRGKDALGEQTDWLNGQKDPAAFINKLMGGYNESPWAHNLQNASVRAGTNAASASGLTGSTPFAQQLQQNASNISSEDQQKWLGNVLGINTQYGQGLNNQVTGGQHSADILSQLNTNQGTNAGQSTYGSIANKNQNNDDMWANIRKILLGH